MRPRYYSSPAPRPPLSATRRTWIHGKVQPMPVARRRADWVAYAQGTAIGIVLGALFYLGVSA